MYALEAIQREINHLINNVCNNIDVEVRTPPANIDADFAIPVFKQAQIEKKSPVELAKEIANNINIENSFIENVESSGGYVNFTVDIKKFSSLVIEDFRNFGLAYGCSEEGKGKTIVIDYSAPNIAKPFSVGHLRSTVIGQALHNIYSFLGYEVIGDNHIGDWGTQFGKLMYAFKKYGNREQVDQNPIPELLNLYVKFHHEAEQDPTLNEEGRAWFKKLENGDPEATEIWKWFTEISWKEFQRIYDLLGGIHFEEVLGESFYNDQLQDVVQEILNKTIAIFPSEDVYQNFITQHPHSQEILKPFIHHRDATLTHFTITNQTLKELKSPKISPDVLTKLESLNNQSPLEYDDFVEHLKKNKIKKKKIIELITEYAKTSDSTTYQITEIVLETLKSPKVSENILEKLIEMKDQKVAGQRKLTALLESKGIQDDETIKTILRYTQNKNVEETIYWVDLNEITNDLKNQLGKDCYSNLQKYSRKIGSWGTLASDEIDAGDEILNQNDVEKQDVILIRLDEFGLETPLLIQKSDGTSLYATRDLATAKYRIQQWSPAEILYVVGGEQQLYFRQWVTALDLMGYKTNCSHIWFGLIRLPEGKMSTRKGRVIFLEDVLNEAIRRTKEILKDREMSDVEKDRIARIVGIGAVKYADLSQERTRDIIFDWDKMMNMQGDSAPYLQYAYVRIKSILRKIEETVNLEMVDGNLISEEKEKSLISEIARFPEVIQMAAKGYYPHVIANYLFSLAQEFNGFYNAISIIRTEDHALRQTRLYLCQMTAQVLKKGLELLGIECPEKM